MKLKTTQISLLVGIFLILTGVSYFLFSSFLPVGAFNLSPNSSNNQDQTDESTETPLQVGYLQFEGPKTEVCPLNGVLFTKEEEEIWSTRRPLAVMIENHADSRPQSGLQYADIVYEAVAEGGITRYMGIFYCNAVKSTGQKYDLGPVRSARTYYLDIASEYADYPLYAHVGGANCSAPDGGACTTDSRAQANEQISRYGWNNKGTWGDLSQFSLAYKVCRREPDRLGDARATEHTMYCSSRELWNVAESRGLTNLTQVKGTSWDKNFTPWSFKADDKASSSPTATEISFSFWGDNLYNVTWKYDATQNIYHRYNGGEAQIDFNTKEILSAKNIIVQFAKETRSIDEHKHNLYQMIGKGTGLLFQNGESQKISWSKATRTSGTVFKDSSGKEVNFVPGSTWVEILPIGNQVDY